MRAAIFWIGVLAISGFGGVSADADTSDSSPLDSVSWITSNQGGLEKLLSTASAEDLVARLEKVETQEIAVGNYMLASLHGDNHVQLLVTVDYSGRGFFSHLLILEQSGGKAFISQSLSTRGITLGDIHELLIDANHDGRVEIVLPTLVGNYRGAKPTEVMPHVYAWSGSKFEIADQTYGKYYESTILPQLSDKLSSVRNKIQDLNSNHTHRAGAQDEISDLLVEQRALENQINSVNQIVRSGR